MRLMTEGRRSFGDGAAEEELDLPEGVRATVGEADVGG